MNLEVLSNGAVRCPDDPGEPGYDVLSRRISITPHEANLLSILAYGRFVVEIGTGLGVSTRAMAKTAALVSTVDVDQWVHENIWPTLPQQNVLTYQNVKNVTPGIDMAFIDGLHTAEALAADIDTVLPMMEGSGLLVFHDVNMAVVRDTILSRFPDRLFFLADNLGVVML